MWLFAAAVFLVTLLGHTSGSTFPGHVVYQGCFSKLNLQRRSGHMIHPFVAAECLELCSGYGHTRVGLDSMNSICYCGYSIMSQISKSNDSLCKPCKFDNNLFCGGVLKISVYEIHTNTVSDAATMGQEHKQSIATMFEEEPSILLAGPNGVFLYNSSSHTLETLVKHKNQIEAIDYHLARREGFAISDSQLFRFPLFQDGQESEMEPKFIADVTRCPTFAVDWVHDIIYYPDCYSHQITFINITEDHYHENILVKPPEGAWAYDMAVDPYKGLLFWTSGPTLWSCRLDGRGLSQVIPSFPVNKVSSLSLDVISERVYFSGLDKHDKITSKVFYTSYSGVTSHPLQFQDYEEGSQISDFGIFKHHIYFLKNVEGFSVLMASKLEYNHVPTIIVQNDHFLHLRLVHPQLQAPRKVDACTNHGCSHICQLEFSLPTCYCPFYYELELDNKTCIMNPGEAEEEPLVVKAALGLMLVLLVLLGAGVLMCLVDKVWSQLHPNVVRLSVQRSFTGRRLDGENLI